ncbi:potassium-transporting ATPase subunit KdpA [Brevifollis gellanilyticus]|uniref:Potassium-transporting ATPase potassium-binding subunit n=1 Tax=Brevifollis gellanilyticus TaxID=748831 RepID=A0A512M5Y5_9BACT|nr:potassium-transporting ATPase subunit KdpA [Brevifollis gellanilyticus]GEP42134.1 potassium-transporting ATPase potassium-binding subunit [Brevifollis gellanilyticus]
MQASDWLQFALFLGLLTLITKPMGLYLMQVLDSNGRTWLDPVVRPVEKLTYKILGVDPQREQGWKQYTFSMLAFSLTGALFTYAILRLQHLLPWNPQDLPGLSHHLAFNTAVSFTTNTNWQSYGGEATLSYFSQVVGLTFHNFVSAAVGIGIAAALVRGISDRKTSFPTRSTVDRVFQPGETSSKTRSTVGNFWTDLVRVTYYLLLPVCVALAIFLVSQGMIQNFDAYTHAKTLEGAEQIITQGPMASQVAIKMLGTNGGGFVNANAAHPFENPTPLSNLIQMLSIFAIGSGLTYYLGRMVKNQGHGWAVWAAMMIMFVGGVLVCAHYEAAGNPIHQQLGITNVDRVFQPGHEDQTSSQTHPTGNMEGKEVRFGLFNSSLFATVTTAASCGAVNSMHDSFTPIGGLVPLFMMELGEVVIGGVGAGLYGMLVFVILAVFIAGLMVGRTPEYLGKKIQAKEVKLAMLTLLVLTLSILGFTAWASVSAWGVAGLNNAGPHGFSEMLYAYSSATANNGSAFAGLTANTPWYNTTLGIAMLIGRFLMIVPIMAIAGSLAAKQAVPAGPGTFPVNGATFTILLIGTVLLIGALNFLPALALGPIVEHFLMGQGQLF